jgi:hypothetical protein
MDRVPSALGRFPARGAGADGLTDACRESTLGGELVLVVERGLGEDPPATARRAMGSAWSISGPPRAGGNSHDSGHADAEWVGTQPEGPDTL